MSRLSRPRHVHAVRGDDRAALGPLLPVERLDDEEIHALEALRLHRRHHRSGHARELHVLRPLLPPAHRLALCRRIGDLAPVGPAGSR